VIEGAVGCRHRFTARRHARRTAGAVHRQTRSSRIGMSLSPEGTSAVRGDDTTRRSAIASGMFGRSGNADEDRIIGRRGDDILPAQDELRRAGPGVGGGGATSGYQDVSRR
jgi:hypothetical protein